MKENPNTALQEELKSDFDYGQRTLQKESKDEEAAEEKDKEEEEQTVGNKEEGKSDPSDGFFDSFTNQNDLNREDKQRMQADKRAVAQQNREMNAKKDGDTFGESSNTFRYTDTGRRGGRGGRGGRGRGGGYQGNRDGGYQGNRDGGYQGNRNNGGYQGNRDGGY